MDKALVFGTKDCRFESCQGHFLFEALVRAGLVANAANARSKKSFNAINRETVESDVVLNLKA